MILAESVGTDLFRAVLQGLPPGAVYALIALGFVLAYKTSGVFNLAFGAQAYISAVVYFKAHTVWGWGIVPSFLLAVVVLAPLLGVVLEMLIFRHLRTAPAIAKLVVTIGLSVALPAIVDLLIDYAPAAGVTPDGVVPDGAGVFYDPFGVYPWSRDELVAMAVCVVAVVGLGALFRFSAIGLRMRAVVESPRMTELNGIDADRVSAFAWALSSLFAGLAGVLIAPRFNTLSAPDFFDLVVVGVTAAAIGGLVSLPRALAGGLGLGVLIAVFNTFLPRWSDDWTWLAPIQDNLASAIPFIVLFGALLLMPSLRRSREATDPLSGVDPPPATSHAPSQLTRRVIIERIVLAALFIVVAVVVMTRADASWMFLVTQAVVFSIIFLSITVITGLAGQISLCQGAFAAIGAFTVFQLVDRYEMSGVGAALVGAVLGAVVGALIALPIGRLRGVWVAIATLAFAFFFDSVMVKLSWVGGTTFTGTRVPRPVIGPWDFGSDKAFLVLAVVVLVVVARVVVHIGNGTLGRTWRALRGSEVAAQSIGISPARARVAAFACSGFIAGLGGAFLAMHQENVNYGNNFAPFAALFWLVIVVTIGVQSVQGAIVAASFFALFEAVILRGAFLGWILRSPERIPGIFPISAKWTVILFGLGAINFARHPEGAIEAQKRRAALKAMEQSELHQQQTPPAAEPSARVQDPVA